MKNAKEDCFAYYNGEAGCRCIAINSKDCANCHFYRNKEDVDSTIRKYVQVEIHRLEEVGDDYDLEDSEQDESK